MGKLSSIAFVFPPSGLCYIAAYLRDKGIEVNIFDSQVQKESIRHAVEKFDPDVVGITCVTSLVYSTLEVARCLKKEFPHKIIVVGGIHPTIRPQDFLQDTNIDYVVVGEGEVTMYELVNAVETGRDAAQIPGVMYKQKGRIIIGPPRDLIQNLDDLPRPAIDLVPLEKYRISPDMRTGTHVGIVFTSRGCPFNCIFCANRILTQGKYRAHSVERVCQEVDELIEKEKINQLFVFDDNFAVNRNRAKKICEEFIRRDFHKKITWWAEARVDCVDEELLLLMAKSGCKIISYGLESGVQRLLDFIEKNITLEQVKQTIEITRKAGIDIRASFILGLPTETREESLKTIQFAKQLDIDQVRFAIATPFPGTKLWDIAQEEGAILTDDWEAFSLMSGYSKGAPVYAPKGRSAEELAKLQRYANISFFLRPKILKVYLKRMIDFGAFRDITIGGMKFIWASLFRDR